MTNAIADMRQEKGRILALDKRIKRIAGATWAVPSQSGETAYLVNELAATCSCPDVLAVVRILRSGSKAATQTGCCPLGQI